MASFDSIINVEEWISDHYFISDEKQSFGKRVADRHKEWKQEAQDSANGSSPWVRFSSARQELQIALATLESGNSAKIEHITELIAHSLGYPSMEEIEVDSAGEPLRFSGCAGDPGTYVVIASEPVGDAYDLNDVAPLGEVTLGEKDYPITTQKLVGEVFLSSSAPEFIVVIAGGFLFLAERDTWALGRFLAIDLSLAIERNDTRAKGEMQRLAVILARENVEKAADGVTWWTETISQSHEHAVKVSEGLREAIKQSIEVIGNDVLSRYKEQGIDTEVDGNELAKQSLRYLYRILFLLFAEASPELEILPTGTSEYDEGYGLGRLRDQILNPPVSEQAKNGTYLYESLQLLFRLVNDGHNPETNGDTTAKDASDPGLTFRNLSADLFLPSATHLIDRCQLSNQALNKVLELLLLSPERRGRDRGYISYATLGVTELGQVYEGLMSFTGSIAKEDSLEVAPKGDPAKGSWVVPERIAEDLPADSFVKIEKEMSEGGTDLVNKRYPKGSFVYRQASRDRERTASFYTPEVLTSFTVGQAIEELQASKKIATADDILKLTICEPAIGSGAFVAEAIRQLADLYLSMKQAELNRQIDPDQRTTELQRVKAYIALHNVYGVDLNATGVELAEITLWLDTMTADLKAPWFGLHLRHGNSLVGSRRATYSQKDVEAKAYLTAAPQRHMLGDLNDSSQANVTTGRIHQFLLPSAGWGSTSDAKDAKDLVPEQIKWLKAWRKTIKNKLTKTQIKELLDLSKRTEVLWKFALTRMQIAEEQIRRDIHVWGQDFELAQHSVAREEIEKELFNNLDGAYQRLRLVMDAWNSLWFWPLQEVEEDASNLPTINEWISTLQAIVGKTAAIKSKDKNQYGLADNPNWEQLNAAESWDLSIAGAHSHTQILEEFPWLHTVKEVAKKQAFFHWDLDFAAVMARGGFDFQVGNPPWVRPRSDVDSLLSEFDPWFKLAHKPTQALKKARKNQLIEYPETKAVLLDGLSETVALSAVLTDLAQYPHLQGQQPDLYRAFIALTWKNSSAEGAISLIHPESMFTEKRAAPLRREAYLRLRRHWQIHNALNLFAHNDSHLVYAVNVYAKLRQSPSFAMASSIYHPQTVSDSYKHDNSGPLPGLKDSENNWDRRPHRNRIIHVDKTELETWHSILEDPSTPIYDTRMVFTVNAKIAEILKKLASAPRMKELGLHYSAGWHETSDKKAGFFDTGWAIPKSWEDVILQGPHLGVSTPMIKQPNKSLRNNQDWSEVDLDAMPEDFIPATGYQRNADNKSYVQSYGSWTVGGKKIFIANTFRVAWRKMAALTGYRTLYPAIIPPGATHIDGIYSAGVLEYRELLAAATSSSIVCDFFIRTTGSANLRHPNFEMLPMIVLKQSKSTDEIVERFLQLNCLTVSYAPLWEQYSDSPWSKWKIIGNEYEREVAQSEIDALVAYELGLTCDELIEIYRSQFPVLRRYDTERIFDTKGRMVPLSLVKQLKSAPEQKFVFVHPQSGIEYEYEAPYKYLEREKLYQKAFNYLDSGEDLD